MKFIVASKNKNKIKELSRILKPLGIEAYTEDELNITIPEVEETGKTFFENAKLKAVSASNAAGIPAIADDSGLCVDALNGQPGIYSARYSGENANTENNNKKLLENMKDVELKNRTAQFVCSICVYFPNGDVIDCTGEVNGVIGFEPKGNGGFGYDPLFLINDKSFAELSSEEKDKISHRGKALKQLNDKLKEYFNVNK